MLSRRGLAVLAVDVDPSRAKADAFLRRVDSDLPVVFDPARAPATRFAVIAMATSILAMLQGRRAEAFLEREGQQAWRIR